MTVWPILVSAAVCFVLGFLSHGPLLGKVWMRLAKVTPNPDMKLASMWKQMLSNYIVNVVCASVLSMFIWIASYSAIMGDMTWYKGAIIGAWLWLGFAAAWTYVDVIWMGKSWKLWLFDALSALVCIAAMGAILGVWR